MAIDASAVLDAVRGVIRGELGAVRTIASGEYAETSHDDTSDGEVWIRAEATVQADVRMTPPHRSKAVGPVTASRGVWVAPIDVVLRYSSQPYADLTPARRYAIREEAAEDVERLILALTWPGNLSVDGSANATGLVSARLSRRTRFGINLPGPTITREEWGDEVGIYEITVPFEAWILSTQAVA